MDLGVAQKGRSHYRAHHEDAMLKSRAQALGTEDPQFSESEVLVWKPVQSQTDTPETWSKYFSSKEPSSVFSFLPTGIFTSDLKAEVKAK